MVSIASELIRSAMSDDRVKTLPGDYRETVFPGGNDVVLFFGIFHQESPESIIKLMQKAYGTGQSPSLQRNMFRFDQLNCSCW